MPRRRSISEELKIKRLGDKLRTIRQWAGLTLDEMGAELGRTDKGRRARVREWELQDREPDLMTILLYARFAGVSTDVLLDDKLDLPLEIRSESNE